MKHRIGYSGTQILLHWTIAVLIVFNYFYSEGMGRALRVRLGGEAALNGAPPPDINPSIHVWVGVAVLVFAIIRLILRETEGVPEAGGKGKMEVAALWGHRLLYLLIFLVPLAGGLTWFGRIHALGDVHKLLSDLLVIVAAGHAIIALYHQFVLRDGLIWRMIRPGSM